MRTGWPQAPPPPPCLAGGLEAAVYLLVGGRGRSCRQVEGNTTARSQGPQLPVLAQPPSNWVTSGGSPLPVLARPPSNWVTLGGSPQCQVACEMTPGKGGSPDPCGTRSSSRGQSSGGPCSRDQGGGPLPRTGRAPTPRQDATPNPHQRSGDEFSLRGPYLKCARVKF